MNENYDTVVIAPVPGEGDAYAVYRRHAVFSCAGSRYFHPATTWVGFYRQRQVKPQLGRILHLEPSVIFDAASAAYYRRQGGPTGERVARAIEDLLADGIRAEGEDGTLIVLTPPGHPDGITLSRPILHTSPTSFAQNQRYVSSAVLRRQPASTEALL